MNRALLALLLLTACPPRTTQVEVKRAVSPAKEYHPASRHGLAIVLWEDTEAVLACSRRVNDDGMTVGNAGPCLRALPGSHAQRGHDPSLVRLALIGRQKVFADDTPWHGFNCWVTIEDAQLVPSRKPARVVMHSPSGQRELKSWMPDGVEGDSFHHELSFSKSGQWMAVLRVAVGLGDGERTVEVVDAEVVQAPKCQ